MAKRVGKRKRSLTASQEGPSPGSQPGTEQSSQEIVLTTEFTVAGRKRPIARREKAQVRQVRAGSEARVTVKH